MERCSLGRVRRAVLVVALLVSAVPTSALGAGARARWLPSADPRIAGYRLYVRAAGSAYGTPIDVGRATAATDGTLSSVIEGLVSTRTYHLAVAAYTADGLESALSGELALGALNSCLIDRCSGAKSCQFGNVADGTWCTHDGDADPCTAIGACVAGKCTASASAGGRLASTRVRVTKRLGEGQLTVRGHFVAPADFDPTDGGATLELADGTGAILYRATVPGDAFDPSHAGRAFEYIGTRREARAYNGLRLLTLFLSGDSGDGVALTARAESVDLRELMNEPEVRVTVRFGATCARDLSLACRTLVPGGLRCG